MRRITGEELRDILDRAEKRLGKTIEFDELEHFPGDTFSREYGIFREENLEGYVTRYEKLCNFSGKILKIKPKEKDRDKLQNAIDAAHLDINVDGVTSFAGLVAIICVLLGIFLGIGLYFFTGEAAGFFGAEGLKSVGFGVFFLPLIVVLCGVLLMLFFSSYPLRIAARWRLRATNQ